MPTGTIATILVIAIFCNLALMVAFLLGPLVRRRPSNGLPGGSGAGRFDQAATVGIGSRADAASTVAWQSAAPIGPRGAAASTVAWQNPAPLPEIGRADRAARAEAAVAPAGMAGGAIPAGDTAAEDRPGQEPLEEEESEVIDLDQPGIEETDRRRRFVLARHDDPRAMRAIDALLSRSSANGRGGDATMPGGPAMEPPAGAAPAYAPVESAALVDAESGLESPLAWERAFRDEAARHVRYRRPVTVVVAEIDGFDRLVQRFGGDAAGRLVPPIAATLRRYGRGSDRIARIGPARFHALLPETDEIQAINYVERVRAECDRWLEAGAIGAHLILGWASPAARTDLPGALGVAERRLESERRLTGERHTLPELRPQAERQGSEPARGRQAPNSGSRRVLRD